MTDARAAVAEAFRAEWGRIVAGLIARTGNWDLAEECTADAFAAALESWPRDGVPDRPGAWLTTTARNRAVDRLRRAKAGEAKLRLLAATATADEPPASDHVVHGDHGDHGVHGPRDDRLRLLYTCCHPALGFEAQVALALRTLTGLTTAEIARAFLVPESTMAKRLVRAKQKIRVARIPYRVPPPHQLPERTGAVLGVVYLLFNEGYGATSGDGAMRPELTREALRLAGLVAELMPDQPEALGLLALLRLHDARAATRIGAGGELVPLEEQDRGEWNRATIAEAVGLLQRALRRERPGPYQLQAMIAACHAAAARPEDTDWPRIVRLYDQLLEHVPSPVVRLNRAVAVAMADGPEAGLALVDAVAPELGDYPLLPATRADLLRRAGRRTEAAEQYRTALEVAGNDGERRYLARRLAELDRV
ncbi:RNA polymerase sigma factor [Jiangella ureilytica]|uniref:RNA polymerase sigma factor n=1 Tax=Jiangella ureilytica TaxID=2530374 RepID=A0A4R4RHP4_9ACTN|nr:RNA polymerase sigma factor [Jiangella ureilytica]TDC48082.1 RNA polymerase sigma factor [Jiangella ureilytica]